MNIQQCPHLRDGRGCEPKRLYFATCSDRCRGRPPLARHTAIRQHEQVQSHTYSGFKRTSLSLRLLGFVVQLLREAKRVSLPRHKSPKLVTLVLNAWAYGQSVRHDAHVRRLLRLYVPVELVSKLEMVILDRLPACHQVCFFLARHCA